MKSVCLIFPFDGSTRAPQAHSPLPDVEGKEELGSFLNHKENRVKPKISTMVFLGERKSILPGAKAEADLEGFPASLFLIVLADREEKSKLKKG